MNGNCYLLTLTGTDNVGNATNITTVVMVDTTAPTVTNVTSTKADGAYPVGTP